MSILCANGCHVYLTGSDRCTCGWLPNVSLTKPYPLSGGVIPGYSPNGFAPPRPPTPPTAGAAPPVSIRVFRAAKNAGASHLSADGLRIYTVRYGETLEAEWKERLRDFGAWGVRPEGLPEDAVKM